MEQIAKEQFDIKEDAALNLENLLLRQMVMVVYICELEKRIVVLEKKG